ncbi:hypothetical protein EKD04_017555 [Chloroflexales bacterium ZM16-3]|nr:hypothetical protein [Chloroflexales bacterium ZM16-3]
MILPQGQLAAAWQRISDRTLARIDTGAEDADELRRQFLRQRLRAHRTGGA